MLDNLLIPIASLLVTAFIGWKSIRVSQEAVGLTEEISERTHSDWKQQKWFDLYLETGKAYDLLDHFQAVSDTLGGPP
jgi:hypothetical protein